MQSPTSQKNYEATLTVMEGGEHWFHTDEQMQFLNDWIKTIYDAPSRRRK